ncbi:hypothetical protein [Nitratireductor sp. ZSWI3]|uniref:hypothetical protein n=1 Tax=Nitratireductor sp. ZSWI3 TaxID=2966359 RepID=UPI0021501750|nr:hypothetical protein [Nitratireductor sp. ZSWI3]MCR4265286.1 hypothetical protein [Nitratireductor sp. ZSWI3]
MNDAAGSALQAAGRQAVAAQGLICVAVAVGIAGVFRHHAAMTVAGGLSLLLFLWLSRRRLGLAALVPLCLSLVAFAGALARGVSADGLLHAADRALFLTALLSMLTLLRQAASRSRDVLRAGAYLTGQPPGRRYMALCFGGHLFGTLINLGGLAILLDMVARANKANLSGLPPALQELRLKRMTLAIVRGFTLVAFWSPLGFAVNSVLLAMPGLDYAFLGPLGLALTMPVFALGWMFDRMLAPRGNRHAFAPPEPAGGSVLRLVGHVALLGLLVMVLHSQSPLSFQEALLITVPVYALTWLLSAGAGRQAVGAAAAGVASTIRALPMAAGEIGVFASAGLLSVLLLEVLPVETIETMLNGADLPPEAISAMLGLATLGLALVGVNPIITVSVLGSLVAQVGIAGLSQAAAAFAMLSAWSAAMGLSPFITTVAYAGAIVGRSPVTVGMRWNGAYAATLLVLSQLAVAGAIRAGWL